MIRSLSCTVLTVLLSALSPSFVLAQVDDAPTFPGRGPPKPIYGQYIVKLKENANPHDESVGLTRAYENTEVIEVFDTALNGFAMRNFPPQRLNGFKNNPQVEDVVQDYEVQAYASVTQASPVWGLDRIDSRNGLDNRYTYRWNGNAVRVYVLDVNIAPNQIEFGSRLRGCRAFGSGSCDTSVLTDSHGTHVAGTIAGNTYGVAKAALLFPVPVLDSNGSGTYSGVIAGVDHVAREKASNPTIRMVANMSLGGPPYQLLDDAIGNAVDLGVKFVVAAGNEGQDACSVSPARTQKAITVAASDRNDYFASFSNYGSCVDIIAPGVGITSIDIYGNPLTISGTSMASPHVAGVMALYLQAGKTPGAMLTHATVDTIVISDDSTINKLVFTGLV